MNKQMPTLFLGTLLVLTACGPARTNTPQYNDNRPIYQSSGTVKEAYSALQATITEALQGQSARLGAVQSRYVGQDGKSKYWTFKYVVDNRAKPDYVTLYYFSWTQGTIEKGSEELMTRGLNTPEYDYLWKDVGSDWVDSPGITGTVYTENTGISKNGVNMDLMWNSTFSESGAVWTVSQGKANIPAYHFNAVTGEKIIVKN